MKNCPRFLPFFFIIFSFGCANLKTVSQAPINVADEKWRLAKIEEAYDILDEPLFLFYGLVRQYEEKLNEYLVSIKEERELERSSLIGLRECFLMKKEKFQEKWREIYNNPETAAEETEKLLHEVKRATIALQEFFRILENILKEIKSTKHWVSLPCSPLHY